MQVRIWGARGSLPSPLRPDQILDRFRNLQRKFFEQGYKSADDIEKFISAHRVPEIGGYGGNTPCVEVSTEQTRIIIDGGSGARLLGYDLMNGP